MPLRVAKSAIGLGAVLLTATLLVVSCPPLVVKPFEGFSYAPRVAPRVFASHSPLRPEPGKPVTIRVAPDVAAGATVEHAFASLADGLAAPVEKECADAGGNVFSCSFDLGPNAGTATYAARIVLADGTRVATRTRYLFAYGIGMADAELIPVRVPVTRVDRLDDAYRIDTAFLRGLGNDYVAAQFVADAEQALFDGILADPVYRWRDDQLGFYLYTRPGITTSYFSGVDTRCGQNPWPAEAMLASALAPMEVLGMLHRLAADASASEGRVPLGPTSSAFRDCAGEAVRTAGGQSQPPRSFSAVGGLPESPAIATHEFGHAAFGLGDEYFETDATRRVDPAFQLQPPAECCCRRSDDVVITPGPGGTGPGTGGGVASRQGSARPLGFETAVCMGPGGSIVPGFGAGSSLPACTGTSADFAATCGASPQGGCPPLASTCVEQRMWLGATPPGADTARHNVFESESACTAARVAAEAHPGVESPQAALGTCRRICGGADAPACPCGQGEAWIVDHDPASQRPRRDDLMALPEIRKLGGTCAWCVDTSLCVRWHRALGDSADAAWATCSAPPRSATGLERALAALQAWINDFVEWVVRHVRF